MAEDESLDARLEGVMGTGDPATRRPVSLTEALYSRIVEVTRQEVSQTTEVLGELIVHMGRLDRRIADIGARLDRGAEPTAAGTTAAAAPAVDLGPVQSRLDHLESMLAGVAERMAVPAPATEPAPPVDIDALSRAIDARLLEIRTAILSGQPDLSSVSEVVNRGLSDVRTAILTGQPDLSPVLSALDGLRAAIPAPVEPPPPPPPPEPVDLSPVLSALDELRAAIPEPVEPPPPPPVPEPVDLSPVLSAIDEVRVAASQQPDVAPLTDVVTQWLSDVRSTLLSRLDEVQGRLDQPLDLSAVTEAVNDRLSAIEGSATAHQAVHSSRIDDLTSTLNRATTELGSRLEALAAAAAAVPEPPELPDPTPAVRALSGALDELRVELAQRDERLGQHLDRLERAAGETAVPAEIEALAGDLRGRLDALQAAVTDGPDVAAVIRGAVAGTNDDLVAELENIKAAVAASGARFNARLDELRSELSGDADEVASRLDARLNAMAAQPANVDLSNIDRDLGEVRQRLADLTGRANAVEAAVTEGLTRLQAAVEQPPDLSDLATGVAAVSERIDRLAQGIAHDNEALAARTDATRGEVLSALGSLDVGAQVDSAVNRLAERLVAIEAGLNQSHEVLTARLDEVREGAQRPLDVGPIIEAQDGKLEQLRGLVAEVARSVEAIDTKTSNEGLGALFDEHASTAIARLQDVTEGMLTRMERRDSQLSSIRVDIEQALGQSLARLQDDLSAVRDAVTADQETSHQLDRLEQQLSQLRNDVSDPVVAGLADVTRDLSATRERILELDRTVTSMKGDLAGSAEAAQASFQAADMVAALAQGVTRLEGRLGIEVDDITRRLDAVAQALETLAKAQPSPSDSQARLTAGVSERLIALREVAAGVSEAIRNDARRRRERRAIESGQRPSG